MRILLSGSTGLIGRALRQRLTNAGHTVIPLVRGISEQGAIAWDPDSGILDAGQLVDIGAVIHLAGESIATKRWTPAQKNRIVASRVCGTDLLARVIAGLPHPPDVFISASAVGYYGDRGDEVLTEVSPPGAGFLADICQKWEFSTGPASKAGIRVVLPRFGAVLSRDGGMLGKMLPLFRMGLGGRIGSGEQWISWIALEDVCEVLVRAIEDDRLSGPINVVSPEPTTNVYFTWILGKAVGKLAIVPFPEIAAKLVLGEMADELLLSSTRAVPSRLETAGYIFRNPHLTYFLVSELADRP